LKWLLHFLGKIVRAEAWRWLVRGVGLAFGIAMAARVVYALLISAKVAVLLFIALLLAAGAWSRSSIVSGRTRRWAAARPFCWSTPSSSPPS